MKKNRPRHSGFSLVSMLLLSGIVSGLALLPPVQSYLGRKVAAIVSENIPQDISIDSIRITPSGSVDLTGIKTRRPPPRHHDIHTAHIGAAELLGPF